jgi:hypothetical protein
MPLCLFTRCSELECVFASNLMDHSCLVSSAVKIKIMNEKTQEKFRKKPFNFFFVCISIFRH